MAVQKENSIEQKESASQVEETTSKSRFNWLIIAMVAVVAVIFGLGVGSFVYFVLIPGPNPETEVPTAFRIQNDGFNKVNMNLGGYPDLNDRKIEVARTISDWTHLQRDNRGNGMYVPMATCTYVARADYGLCSNPSATDSNFYSNRSFAPVIWGTFKYYQNTKDEAALEQVKADLLTVKSVVLDHPDQYFIQNNDYSCLFLKDLYWSTELDDDSKKIIYDICDQATYELADMTGLTETQTSQDLILAKVKALLSAPTYSNEAYDVTWDTLIAQNDLDSRDFYLSLFNDYRLLPELVTVAQMNPNNSHNVQIVPLMDVLLSEYNYMGGLDINDSYYDSSEILALTYYSQFVDRGQNPEIMQLAQKIYNEHYNPETASTVAALTDYALVQYHLVYPMSPVQNSLVAYFESEFNEFVNGRPEFIYDTGLEGLGGQFNYEGNVSLNGLISGILSI